MSIAKRAKRALTSKKYLDAFEKRNGLAHSRCRKIAIGEFLHVMWIDAPDSVGLVTNYDREYKELTIVEADGGRHEDIDYDQVLAVLGDVKWPSLPKGAVK